MGCRIRPERPKWFSSRSNFEPHVEIVDMRHVVKARMPVGAPGAGG